MRDKYLYKARTFADKYPGFSLSSGDDLRFIGKITQKARIVLDGENVTTRRFSMTFQAASEFEICQWPFQLFVHEFLPTCTKLYELRELETKNDWDKALQNDGQ